MLGVCKKSKIPDSDCKGNVCYSACRHIDREVVGYPSLWQIPENQLTKRHFNFALILWWHVIEAMCVGNHSPQGSQEAQKERGRGQCPNEHSFHGCVPNGLTSLSAPCFIYLFVCLKPIFSHFTNQSQFLLPLLLPLLYILSSLCPHPLLREGKASHEEVTKSSTSLWDWTKASSVSCLYLGWARNP